MELACCVRLTDSIVGMKILTSKAKIRLSCPVFPQPQCVFGINFYWKTVLPSNGAWNRLRWSTLPYHCIFTGYCSNTNKDQVDWHAVKNWSLVNWSNQFCITQMGSPGIPHSLDFFITSNTTASYFLHPFIPEPPLITRVDPQPVYGLWNHQFKW